MHIQEVDHSHHTVAHDKVEGEEGDLAAVQNARVPAQKDSFAEVAEVAAAAEHQECYQIHFQQDLGHAVEETK